MPGKANHDNVCREARFGHESLREPGRSQRPPVHARCRPIHDREDAARQGQPLRIGALSNGSVGAPSSERAAR